MGRDGGQRGSVGDTGLEKGPACPLGVGESAEICILSSTNEIRILILSSTFLWATHGAKLCSHVISFSPHNLERKPLHYHRHPFHRWES